MSLIADNAKFSLKNNLIVSALYLFLSYPLFYYAYKFCLPDFGGQDYYSYYLMYKDWDFASTPSPFNMRLISAFFIFLMNKIGFYYETEIVFTKIYIDADQQIFFNAILFNYICVLLTCLVICRTVLRISSNKLYAFFAGCVYLFGFGTLFFSLKPISEACGILLLAIAFYYYLKRSYWIYVLLCFSLFQREYIFFAFAIIAMIDFYFHRLKYYLVVFSVSVVLFLIYVVMRETFFYTPHFQYQMSFATFAESLIAPKVDWLSFIKQSLFLSNILLLYFSVVLYKKINGLNVNRNYLINIIFLFAQVIAMSIIAQFGNNAGRYFYYTTPIIIFYLFFELKPLLSSYIHFNNND